jgi:2,3,4,5-tetrahydropyridine-2,6-dicarboxylate N-succinyltransferase
MPLREQIESLVATGESADKHTARAAFAELRRALSAGSVRAAEPDPSAPTGWRVNAWVKQGILLGFRFGDLVEMGGPAPLLPFYDKDTMPLKRPGVSGSIRIVPGGSAIRDGAFVAKGVICMPPMYINIGAYVGEGTLVDSHALVGSCAQIGNRVHISAGAQIGGVIEPVGAMPVIVEDDVLVGGNTGIYEGAVIKARAVIAAGTVLTGSTPVYDLPNGTIIKPAPGEPLVIPEGAVVVPGARAVSVGVGREWGLSLATPVIVKYRDDRTDTRTELETWIR